MKKQNFVSYPLTLTKSSLALGLGANILGNVGGPVSISGQQGLQEASNFLPVLGSLYGAKMVLKQTKKLF